MLGKHSAMRLYPSPLSFGSFTYNRKHAAFALLSLAYFT
jgi:hypothetical protein